MSNESKTAAALAERIGLSQEAIAQAQRYPLDADELAAQYSLLRRSADAFIADNDAQKRPAQRYLALFYGFLPRALAAYTQSGISEQVFVDTFRDLARWEEKHFLCTGEHGVSEQEWLVGHYRMELFALGELQFQPAMGAPRGLPPEWRRLTALNVHIPKGADLTQKDAAYRAALTFFHLPHALFLCHSWLLSPKLPALLPRGGRILDFQRDFSLLSVDYGDRQAEERIFDAVLDDFSAYPEDTTLRRAAKACLLRGEKIPAALGAFAL